ncbi:hypothetical protein GH808_11280 [Acetobacterium fimetarium]|uniref:FlgN protein n=1 Tax=Acetobacterium fimetarium TaxID=52691 RepID=A0ABR6WWW4_9FIRM|nr:flagellar export chaperone FlgN [Acetobacterium fimetarium]MBC3805013.1 hypothetical protein [Acetobacterium fimetarium]
MSENKNDKQIVEDFYNYIFGVIKLHRELTPKLKDELMLIQSNSLDELNQNLNYQQTFIYQIKNFDEKVADYMKKLNLSGNNLSEVIKQLPQDEQERFDGLLQQFRETSREMQFYKEKCKTLLETKLYVVNKNIAQFDLKSDKITYQEDGTETKKTEIIRTFEKSI